MNSSKIYPILFILLLRFHNSKQLPIEGHDLKEVIRLSFLFYEAQRSGALPENSRIPWRGDSALGDKGINGEDLTDGYYDATDFVKFSFTMAFTTTLLAWGILSYKDAYIEAGQYKHSLSAVKWASDYFIKCHVSPNELYGQVGDFGLDHQFWGRPEDLNMSRPAYKIDEEHPGSDLAGETAAALAATSILFKNVNETYSKITLHHAIQLYDFAVNFKGLYNDAIPGAKQYYESMSYVDEITWAAAWLFKATNDKIYLEKAEQHYSNFKLKDRPNEFFYNKKNAGVQVLLAEFTNQQEYLEAVQNFCDFSTDQQKRTPKGLIFIEKLGTLSHASNIAFICLKAADLGISPEKYEYFARQQINYILGDSGRSYVIGYGENYPKRPYHAASSCPNRPKKCDWSNFNSTKPNPQILYGALVSGPDENDYYKDIREENLYNEVSLDYNAGFTGVCAGLLQREILKRERFIESILEYAMMQ